MSPGLPGAPRDGRLVAVLAIVLVALSMRTAVGIIGPVFSSISDDLGLDVLVLSFVGAAPPVAFALAGLVVPPLTKRWGLEGALLAALVAIAVGQVARALSGEATLLVASTFVAVLGIGATNVLLPPLVRRYFPDRIPLVTASYLVIMSVNAPIPAFTGVLLAETLGWRVAVGMWALFPLLALAPWIALLRGPAARADRDPVPIVEFDDGADPGPRSGPRRPVVFSPTTWALTGVLALSGITIYVAMGYLPTMLVDAAGVDPHVAGAAVGIAVVLGIPEGLLVPLLARRRGTVIPMVLVSGAFAVLGWGGMLLAPAAAPLLWATCIGLVSIVFPLSLLLVNTRTRDHRVTVSVSAFVQGVGYIVAGIFSFVLGVVHDATGAWTIPFVVAAATAVLVVPASLVLARNRTVDDELTRPR